MSTAPKPSVRPAVATRGPVLALTAVVSAAVLVRLWVLGTLLDRLDGDEGVTGVMAQRILDGHFPAFFGSQNYQGAAEQYLQALVIWGLPDTPFTLRLAQVALIAVILVFTYLLAQQVTQSAWGGVFAAGLLAVGPYYFTTKGLQSHGGYDGAVLACLVAALAALRMEAPGRRGVIYAFVAGLGAGVAVWENPTAVYVVIPVALIVRRHVLIDLMTLRTAWRRPIDLVLLALVITPVLYAASPFTWFTAEPRYLFVLYPFTATAITAGLLTVSVREFRVAGLVTAMITATFLPAVTLADTPSTQGSVIPVRSGMLDLARVPEIAQVLERQGVTHAYANYWIAGPLQFATGNGVQVASGHWSQFPDIEREVRLSRAPAIVVPTAPGASRVRALLRASGRRFGETVVGGTTVFTRISPAWHPPPLSFVLFPT